MKDKEQLEKSKEKGIEGIEREVKEKQNDNKWIY